MNSWNSLSPYHHFLSETLASNTIYLYLFAWEPLSMTLFHSDGRIQNSCRPLNGLALGSFLNNILFHLLSG